MIVLSVYHEHGHYQQELLFQVLYQMVPENLDQLLPERQGNPEGNRVKGLHNPAHDVRIP